MLKIEKITLLITFSFKDSLHHNNSNIAPIHSCFAQILWDNSVEMEEVQTYFSTRETWSRSVKVFIWENLFFLHYDLTWLWGKVRTNCVCDHTWRWYHEAHLFVFSWPRVSSRPSSESWFWTATTANTVALRIQSLKANALSSEQIVLSDASSS